MRIEPKTYFANERTFLAWLHTAVLIGTIGAGLVSVHMGGGGTETRGTRTGVLLSGSTIPTQETTRTC
jgi:uncharacterized membrane protein YidH (DUF202 family)